MISKQEQSFLDIAESILKSKKEPVDLYELFDMVVEKQGEGSNDIVERLNAFYADITTSARFVYMGNNTWDLKRHQKIELWEKDGSFFNEYSEVEDDVMDQRIAEQKEKEAQHLAMLERREKAQAEQAEAKEAEEASISVTPTLAPDDVIEAAEEYVESVIEEKQDDKVEVEQETDKEVETTDDVEEEYDDFDEEEYNEYMDEFEDKYDK